MTVTQAIIHYSLTTHCYYTYIHAQLLIRILTDTYLYVSILSSLCYISHYVIEY